MIQPRFSIQSWVFVGMTLPRIPCIFTSRIQPNTEGTGPFYKIRQSMKILREILSPLIAVIAAFVVGGLIIALLGDNPFEAYGLLLSSSFGSVKDIGWTLHYATPLIFTGLAVAVAFRCGLLNIGAEGQLYVAAFATAWVGIKFGGTIVNVFGKDENWSWMSLPAVILIPLC